MPCMLHLHMSCTLREHMFDVTVTTYVATLAHAMFLVGVWCSVDGLCRKNKIGLQPADMYDLAKENAWLP